MADREVTPTKPNSKQIKLQKLARGEKADLGGDVLDRYSGQYAKNPPPRDEEPFLY